MRTTMVSNGCPASTSAAPEKEPAMKLRAAGHQPPRPLLVSGSPAPISTAPQSFYLAPTTSSRSCYRLLLLLLLASYLQGELSSSSWRSARFRGRSLSVNSKKKQHTKISWVRERESGGTGFLFEEPNPTGSRPRDLIGLYMVGKRDPNRRKGARFYSRGKPSTCG